MFCFKCLDEISKGNLEEVKKLREACEFYKSNQCTNMEKTNSFVDEVQDKNIKLFPKQYVKYLIGTVSILGISLLVSVSLINKGEVGNNITSSAYTSQVPILQKVSSFDDEHRFEAFLEVSNEYNFFSRNTLIVS